MSSLEPRPTLDELLETDGVVGAGEFSPDGSLVENEATMEMSDELAAMSAQFCASVTMLFDMLGGAFSEMSGMEWAPQQGWAYSGGRYTVAIRGNRGIFVDIEKPDYTELFTALIGAR